MKTLAFDEEGRVGIGTYNPDQNYHVHIQEDGAGGLNILGTKNARLDIRSAQSGSEDPTLWLQDHNEVQRFKNLFDNKENKSYINIIQEKQSYPAFIFQKMA